MLLPALSRNLSHLGEWLLGKDELDIVIRNRRSPRIRGSSASEVIQAIVVTKENLWDFLKRETVMDRAIEIMGELELSQMLEMFFDRASYYAAIGWAEKHCPRDARKRIEV